MRGRSVGTGSMMAGRTMVDGIRATTGMDLPVETTTMEEARAVVVIAAVMGAMTIVTPAARAAGSGVSSGVVSGDELPHQEDRPGAGMGLRWRRSGRLVSPVPQAWKAGKR